jgi:hypothetical protein
MGCARTIWACDLLDVKIGRTNGAQVFVENAGFADRGLAAGRGWALVGWAGRAVRLLPSGFWGEGAACGGTAFTG